MPNVVLDEINHIYTVDGLIARPSVTELLKWAGYIDDTWFTEYGRLRGKLTHKVIHYFNTGDLDEDTVDPVLQGYFKAYVRFLADSGFVVINSELCVYSEAVGIPGTLDLEGYFPRTPKILHIGDNKSNKVYDWTRLQTALYAMSRPGYRRRFGLELHANGTYKVRWFDDPFDIAEARDIVKRYREAL